MSQSNARGSATRSANMRRRRQKILDCARQIIAQQGFDAFTYKELAQRAGVTIPTIHNLIGSKPALLEKLVEEMVTRIEQVQFAAAGDPLLTTEAFVDRLHGMFQDDEDFYRAAYVAADRSQLLSHSQPSGIYEQSIHLAAQVCIDGREQGYLEGQIDEQTMAYQMFGAHRLARHDWVAGFIDLTEYRRRALGGVCVALAADATPAFRQKVLSKLRELSY